MKLKKLEKGDHVRISPNISKTTEEFQSNDTMLKMAGNVHEIDDDYNAARDDRIHIRGYVWHVDDIHEVNIEKKSQNFHFNIKELVT